jgi:hypothetical protein
MPSCNPHHPPIWQLQQQTMIHNDYLFIVDHERGNSFPPPPPTVIGCPMSPTDVMSSPCPRFSTSNMSPPCVHASPIYELSFRYALAQPKNSVFFMLGYHDVYMSMGCMGHRRARSTASPNFILAKPKRTLTAIEGGNGGFQMALG